MSTKGIAPIYAGITAALLVGGAAVAYVLFSTYSDSGIALPASVSGVASSSISLPAQLRIPALGIDARVQLVGRTAEGTMAMPKNFTDVGWYTGGPRPGGQGSAVIAGHVDNALALDGVFKHLNSLHVDDDVYIDTATGDRMHFRVTKTVLYPYDQVPLHEVFSKTDGVYLNLITCGGRWLSNAQTYDHRLVVYTELVGYE